MTHRQAHTSDRMLNSQLAQAEGLTYCTVMHCLYG